MLVSKGWRLVDTTLLGRDGHDQQAVMLLGCYLNTNVFVFRCYHAVELQYDYFMVRY